MIMNSEMKLRDAFAAMVCAIGVLLWAGAAFAQATTDASSSDVTSNVVHVPALGALTVKGDSTNGLAVLGNCPDISCSSSCACNTGSGTAQATPLGKVTYNLQVLSDVSNGISLDAGSGRDCTGAAAILTLTAGANEVKADATGVICSTPSDQIAFTGTYVITPGVGKYTEAFGTGNISWGLTSPGIGGINNNLFLTGSFAP
jgi:hypothetical protein